MVQYTEFSEVRTLIWCTLQIKLEFENVGFEQGAKTVVPKEKPLGASNQQQTQPTYGINSRIEPKPHWWEASALTITASLLACFQLHV